MEKLEAQNESLKERMRADTKRILTRSLVLKDADQIKYVDSVGDFEIFNFIEDMLENTKTEQDYAYGIFLDDLLVGYCTIGGADEVEEATCYDELLGDVFILEEYQHHGYGTKLVEFALSQHKNRRIYADILNDELFNFYSRLGFRKAEENGLIILDN